VVSDSPVTATSILTEDSAFPSVDVKVSPVTETFAVPIKVNEPNSASNAISGPEIIL
jgi:hypothetical protein